jgi:hypothetical protein
MRHGWGWPGRGRRRPGPVLLCFRLHQRQRRAAEKHGNEKTREHDNLIDMSLLE